VHELDGVRVPEPVGANRRLTPALSAKAQLDACGAVRPCSAAGWAVDHAEQRPDGQPRTVSEPWLDLLLIPTSE
jgi:hypothetical protein